MPENNAPTLSVPPAPAPHEAPRPGLPEYDLGPQPPNTTAWSDRSPNAVPPNAVPPNGSLRDKLRTPVVAALAGAVIVFGVGFGSGYVVGHDRGEASTTGVQSGQGGPGGQGGFGGGGFPGGGRNFGGQNVQQNQNGQPPAQPGTQGSTGTDGTTGSTT